MVVGEVNHSPVLQIVWLLCRGMPSNDRTNGIRSVLDFPNQVLQLACSEQMARFLSGSRSRSKPIPRSPKRQPATHDSRTTTQALGKATWPSPVGREVTFRSSPSAKPNQRRV